MAENYRNLIIGSGEGGKFLAWTLARRGEKTAVVERSMIGGSCPNIACLPSKNVIFSAKVASLVAPKSGIGVVKGSFEVDMPGVARRKREMVEGLRDVHLNNFKTSGAELVLGEARFTAPKTFEVALNDGGSRQLQGDRVFLCLGSRAAIPNLPGLVDAKPMTHVEALDLERLPEHLVVIGGGYVGLEFAQAMRRFGSRVTIVQRGKQLLEREDPDVAAAIADVLREEGVEILLEAELLSVSGVSGSVVELRLRGHNSERTLKASDILVAAGRTPNTDRIALDTGGVELDARRFIRVNDRLQTTAADVWAMGDCAGSPQFTHVGYDDFRVVLNNLDGGTRSTRDRLIPSCLFTDPELARVGLSEADAKSKNIRYRIAKIPMKAVLRTRTISDSRGFAKALIAPDDQILGFTALGAEASELLAAVQTAMLAGMPYTKLKDAIFTHPTAAEGLVVLFSSPLSDAN